MAIIKSGGFFYGALHRVLKKARSGDTVILKESINFKDHIYLESAVTIKSDRKNRVLKVPDSKIGFIISEGTSGDFIFENLTIVLNSKCNFLFLPERFSGRIIFKNVTISYSNNVDPRDYYSPIAVANGDFSRLDFVFDDCNIEYLQNSCTTCSISNSKIGNLFAIDSVLLCERLSLDSVVTERIKFESRYIDAPLVLSVSNLKSVAYTKFVRCDGQFLNSSVGVLNDKFSEILSQEKTKNWNSLFKDESLVISQILPYIFIECGVNSPFVIKNFKSNGEVSYPISLFLFDRCKIVLDNCSLRSEHFMSRAISSDLRLENTKDQMEWSIEDVKLSNQNSTSSLFDQSSDLGVTEGTALERLDKMIGLKNVKTQVNRMVSVAKVEAEKRKRGLQSTNDFSLHMVFGGRPGTGKTVVAKLLGEAMYEEGILPTKNFVVASRSDLVDDKVGGSALKTKAVIEQAIGGVLFIDEAYMLASQGDNDFAEEVVAELIQAAENNRDELIVIMAGYTKDMVHFFETGNEGLRSRFTNWIEFPDYNAKELLQILNFQLKESDIIYDDQTYKILVSEFKRLLKAELDRTGGYIDGNGRFVRNYKQELQMTLSDRIAQELMSNPNLSNDAMRTLIASDISIATDHMISKL